MRAFRKLFAGRRRPPRDAHDIADDPAELIVTRAPDALSRLEAIEHQLTQISRRVEAHLADSPLAAVEFALDGAITLWSPAAEKLFGYLANEIVGKNLSDFPWLRIGEALARCDTKAGEIVDIEWRQSHLRDTSGERQSTLWLGLDVTARNQAAADRRENEERFRASLEQAPAGMSHIDKQGRFLMVNDKFCRIVGRSREELMRLSIDEITHPDDVAADAQHRRALADGVIQSYCEQKRYLRKDGATVWVNLRVSMMRDAAGPSRYLLSIVSDLSGQKKAEAQLQRSRDRYRFLADAMPCKVFTATPDGRTDYNNRRWLAYSGQSFQAALGAGWSAAAHPDDAARYRAGWEAAVSTGAPYEAETRLRSFGGEYRWHLVRATAMRDKDAKIVQWVGAGMDIEDQKQAEAELERKVAERTAEAGEQARRAQAANLAKSNFLAMMSHEIRTPMNVIVGLADLIDQTALPEAQREYVRMLRTAGATLLAVINDVLDLGAVEARHLRIQEIAFDPGEVLRTVISLLLPQAQARGLKLECHTGAGLPKRVTGDPDRLRQILLNLAGNAIKFTSKGSVTVRVEAVPLDVSGSAALTFSIIDTGVGIPREKLGQIFEPGVARLGLSISRHLVELMNGRIWAESKAGRGSAFHFTVTCPVPPDQAPADPAESPERAAYSAPPNRYSILLVDGSGDNVFVVREYLRSTPYLVDVAESGVEAVAKVESGAYDLILMDVQMPDMDGYTATGIIRAWESEQNRAPMPILALTAHALSSETEKSIQAGSTAHLAKPIQRQTLLAALSAHTADHTPGRIRVVVPEGFEELTPDYLLRKKDEIGALRVSLEGGDYDSIRRAAHDIKGAGASYGFVPLTDAGRKLEQAAAAHDLAQMARVLNNMEAYLQSVELIPQPSESRL
jgi:PAS domain S-box-containing protein